LAKAAKFGKITSEKPLKFSSNFIYDMSIVIIFDLQNHIFFRLFVPDSYIINSIYIAINLWNDDRFSGQSLRYFTSAILCCYFPFSQCYVLSRRILLGLSICQNVTSNPKSTYEKNIQQCTSLGFVLLWIALEWRTT
jgi:hypothetical protein